jgi:hypothetical protein
MFELHGTALSIDLAPTVGFDRGNDVAAVRMCIDAHARHLSNGHNRAAEFPQNDHRILDKLGITQRNSGSARRLVRTERNGMDLRGARALTRWLGYGVSFGLTCGLENARSGA